MSTPQLRDYQNETIDSVFKEWEAVQRTLAVVPTGGGKSAIAAEVIRRIQPARALFVCHREELVWQFRTTLKRFANLDADIEMADIHTGPSLFNSAPVVIATVQTLNANWGGRTRMGKFKPEEFGVLVCDEFHHAVAPTWKNVMNYMTQNPKLKVLGITATPDRADELALGQICDTVAIDIEILDLIDRGWLVPVEQQFVEIAGLDFSDMRTTAGDLNGADLAAVMESEKNLQGVASSSMQIIGDRRSIVFTASVKQAEVLSNIFNRHKTGMADWVCGMTNKDTRRATLEKFKEGSVQVICNCGVLTEGFDDPGVSVIIMARPTKSRSLYAQMAGRSTRPLPGLVDGLTDQDARKAAIASSTKPSCLIVDFVGNSGKHKLMTSADILGGKVSDDAIVRAIKVAKAKGVPVRISEELLAAEAAIRKEAEERRLAEEARKAKLVAKVKYSTKTVNPFDLFQIAPTKERGWDQGKVLSEKQKALLMKQGINPESMPYAQGKQVLNEMFRRWDKKLATMGQLKVLKRYGYTDANITFEQASGILNRLSGNHWKPLTTK